MKWPSWWRSVLIGGVTVARSELSAHPWVQPGEPWAACEDAVKQTRLLLKMPFKKNPRRAAVTVGGTTLKPPAHFCQSLLMVSQLMGTRKTVVATRQPHGHPPCPAAVAAVLARQRSNARHRTASTVTLSPRVGRENWQETCGWRSP
jgi:hypothetical protein